jgi:hypothetical protein
MAKQRVVNVTLTLSFPRGVTQRRAQQIAHEVARAIRVELEESGSDLWPHEVPTLSVDRRNS